MHAARLNISARLVTHATAGQYTTASNTPMLHVTIDFRLMYVGQELVALITSAAVRALEVDMFFSVNPASPRDRTGTFSLFGYCCRDDDTTKLPNIPDPAGCCTKKAKDQFSITSPVKTYSM